MRYAFCTLIFTIMLALAGAGLAKEELVRTDLGVKLFLKIITYDDNFANKVTDSIVVYTVYDRSVPDSYGKYLEVQEFFRSNPDLKVQNTSVVFRPVTVDAVDSIIVPPQDSTYRIALMTNLKSDRFEKLTSDCAAKGIRTFSFDPAHVLSWVAVGLRIENGQPKILVNLDISKREGSKYSAHLLKMCEIVEGKH